MRHHKGVWKKKFKLIFILIQLSEMHGARRVRGLLQLPLPAKGTEFNCLTKVFLELAKALSKKLLDRSNFTIPYFR